MAIYTSKFTQQEIDDGIDNANSAVQPSELANYLPLIGGTLTGELILTSSATSAVSILKCKNGEWFDQSFNLHLDASSGSWNLFNNNSGAIITAMRSSGNVGIGNGSPSYKLDVNGSVRATSFITNGGTSSQFVKGDGSLDTKSYLPLTSGTLTGELVLTTSSTSVTSVLKCKGGEWFDQNFNLNLAASSGSWNLFNNSRGEIITAIRSSGNVGIGNGSPSYKLHVNGTVGATQYNNTSDIRKKDIIENINLDIEDIANAPLFKFSWLDPEMPEGVNVGTSAQYWKTIIPEIVSEANDDEKTLSMQYGVAGLASSITLAKKVVEQENTIKAQEARIKALEDAIVEIQNKLK